MLNEGVDFTIIDHFIGAGALWTFLLALGIGVSMVATEIVYGILWLTLGLDSDDAPDILRTHPLRKYFFCFWERSYTDSMDTPDSVVPMYLCQAVASGDEVALY